MADSAVFHMALEGTPRDLHPIIQDEIYRIAREALRNAFSHAEAHRVEAELTYGEHTLRLRIRDDGKGMATEILEQGRSGHYGIQGMREGARQTGGVLEIWTEAGAGTRIEFSVAGPIAYATAADRRFSPLFCKEEDDCDSGSFRR
jgi:signal transduction histidine kinase